MMEGARASVAGIRIIQEDGSSRTIVLARGRQGWVADAATIAAHLGRVKGSGASREPDPARLRSVIRSLTGAVRAALRAGNGAQLAAHSTSPAHQTALRRLMVLARRAASIRATERLRLLSAGIGFLRRGLTAGESRMAEAWVTLGERELYAALARLPVPEAAAPAQRVELIGLLIV
jgi:hypothetical protein